MFRKYFDCESRHSTFSTTRIRENSEKYRGASVEVILYLEQKLLAFYRSSEIQYRQRIFYEPTVQYERHSPLLIYKMLQM